jgi:hypothetical protein
MKVILSIKIGNLKKYLPDPTCELIFNGMMLRESELLAFYSVSDGDFLVALSKGSDSANMWMHMTEDKEAFSEMMRSMIDPKVSREFARLKDLRLLKFSERSGPHRLGAFFTRQFGTDRGTEKTVIPTSDCLTGPICTELPICWGDVKQTLPIRTCN